MNDEATMKKFVNIVNLDPSRVERVYSGRPGCGCGCRGKYYEDARNIKRVLKAMRDNITLADRIDFSDNVAAVEGSRYHWAYLKPEPTMSAPVVELNDNTTCYN